MQTSPGFGLLLVIKDHLLNQTAREHVMDAEAVNISISNKAVFIKVMFYENKELYDEVKYCSYMNQIFLTKTAFKWSKPFLLPSKTSTVIAIYCY